MRRRLKNTEPENAKPARVEPMVEGPTKPAGRRSWGRMSDVELVAHAKRIIDERRIGGRKELAKADYSLYRALRRRKLLDEIGLVEKLRDWAGMEKDELIAHAKRFIGEKGVGGRKELEKADLGLYEALRSRKLLDGIGLPNSNEGHRGWTKLRKEELIAHAKRFIGERGVRGRGELEKADLGLYEALRRRKLLDEIGLVEKLRDWVGMEKDELVTFAKRFIEEREVGGREELQKADLGLYQALWKRKLLDEIGLPNSNEGHRGWTKLRKEELIAHAKRFIGEMGVGGRGELEKADLGLYSALKRRKLLDAVFSDAESSKHAEAVDGVMSALESFGDDE